MEPKRFVLFRHAWKNKEVGSVDDFDKPVKSEKPAEGEKSAEPKEKPAEEKSLMELIGASTADSGDAPKRVDYREDESGSGMVKLANLVAGSATSQAKAQPLPILSPDAAAAAPLPSQSVPLLVQQKKKTRLMFAIAGGVALVAVAVVVVVVLTAKKEPSPDQLVRDSQIAMLKAELDKMKQAPSEEPKNTAAVQPIQEPKPPVMPATDTGTEQANAPADTASEKPAPEKQSSAKGARTTSRTSKTEPLDDAPSKPEPEVQEEVAAKPSSKNQDALDDLLNAPKSEVPSKKKSTAEELPKTLSREDVKKVMDRVAASAKQKCSKYGAGTVQLQILVGSSGRVNEATSKGSLANTTAGKCVEMLAKTAKFPKFSDPVARVAYPITLK